MLSSNCNAIPMTTMGILAYFSLLCECDRARAQVLRYNNTKSLWKIFWISKKNNMAFRIPNWTTTNLADYCKYEFLSENYMYGWVVSAHLNGLSESTREYVAMPHTYTYNTKHEHEFNPIVYLFAVCFASIGYLFFTSSSSFCCFRLIHSIDLITRKWKRNQCNTIPSHSYCQYTRFHHLVMDRKCLFIICQSKKTVLGHKIPHVNNSNAFFMLKTFPLNNNPSEEMLPFEH